MQNFISLAQIDSIVQEIRNKTSTFRELFVGIILGSGLNDLADSVQEAVQIPYSDLPNFPVSTVQGHAGRFVIGKLEGRPVLVMQGRIHYYEG
jgi:purine-nucleoside phosphorylase